MWDTLVDWTQGTLGRIIAIAIAIAIIIVGGCIGVVRQSLMTFAVGLAMGMGLYNAPTIIESIMGSTLEHLPAASGVLPGLGNGLGLQGNSEKDFLIWQIRRLHPPSFPMKQVAFAAAEYAGKRKQTPRNCS